jgi:plasmid stabilization system protein ParE
MDKKAQSTGKNYSVNISNNAQEHLVDIEIYIAFKKEQPWNAIKVIDDFYETFEAIQKNPWVFVKCKRLPHKNNIYRQARCHKWTIIFKIIDNNVLILAIIHGANQSTSFDYLKSID